MEEYIRILTEQIRCKKARDLVGNEMRAHMEDQAFSYEEQGMDRREAVQMAVKEMGDPVEAGISLDRIHRPQMAWGMVALMAVIGLISILVHIAIEIKMTEASLGHDYIAKQIAYTGIGFLIMLGICMVDYSVIARNARAVTLCLWCLLILAHLTIRIEVNGAARWICILGIPIDLVSFTYLFVPLYGAILYKYRGEKWKGIIKSLLWIFVAVFPNQLFPDLSAGVALTGMMLLLFSFAVWMDWFKIRNRKRFLILFGIGVIAAVPILFLFLWATGQIAPYQGQRLAAFIGAFKGEGREGVNYVFFQNRDLISQSRFWGAGRAEYLEGMLPGNMFNTDYILTFLASCYGYVTIILLAALFGVFIFRIFQVAFRQKNQVGMMMSCGCGMVFLVLTILYFMENISLLPIMSSELPFFSAGATNKIISFILAGIVLSTYRFKSILPKELPQKKSGGKIPRLKISISFEK